MNEVNNSFFLWTEKWCSSVSLWLIFINTVYISIADLVANETSDSSKSVTNVITDMFTTKLVKYKKFPDNEKQEQWTL